MRKIFKKMPRLGSVKYIVALCVGVAIIGFGGGSSVWAHYAYMDRIHELEAEIEHYDGEYRRDQAQIHQLQTNPKSMERIAREHYFMKMPDEDIFVLSDDNHKPSRGLQIPSDIEDETIE